MAQSAKRTRWWKSVTGTEVPPSKVEEFLVPDDYEPGSDAAGDAATVVAEMRERGRDIYLSEDGGKTTKHVGVRGAIDRECTTVLYALKADPEVLSVEEFEALLVAVPGPPGWAKRYFAAELERLIAGLPAAGGVQ